MKKYIIKMFLAFLFVIGSLMSCTGYSEDVIDMLEVNRAFAPVELKAFIRTRTTVELNWTSRNNVDHYVVEISENDAEFTNIIRTINVNASELPLQVQLGGETVYSIRVKAVINGLEDSKWTIITATTLTEQIFTGIVDSDVLATEATLRWIPNSNVTQIVLTPGDITHVITAQEQIEGIAKITGLSGETAYTATLYNGTKIRGVLNFTTGIDVGDATLVKPTDNLLQKIADAASGAVLVLEPGDYTAQTGTITLIKSISLVGLRSFDKPKLNVSFSLSTGAANLTLTNLDLKGDTFADVVKFNDNTNYGILLISGCTIYNYSKSLFTAANTILGKIDAITVENSVITNINATGGGGGEFLDFRGALVANITLRNSTFNNCAPTRAFIRADVTAGGLSGTGQIFSVSIDACTFYKVSNVTTNNNQLFYIRFLNNSITVKNSLFAETEGKFVNHASTSAPTFTNNNYFNAATLNLANPTSPLKSDAVGTSIDPGFTNAATGDFTISNQTLKDRLVGDPRWIKG